MAYNKKTWLARLGQGLNKFILNGGSRVTLESSPDTVTQQGTPLSAENMNDLEDRIDSEFTNVNSAINAISDTVDGMSTVKDGTITLSSRITAQYYHLKKIGRVVELRVYFKKNEAVTTIGTIETAFRPIFDFDVMGVNNDVDGDTCQVRVTSGGNINIYNNDTTNNWIVQATYLV